MVSESPVEPVVEPALDSVDHPEESEDKDKQVDSQEKEEPEESSLVNDAPSEPVADTEAPKEEIDKETQELIDEMLAEEQ